MVNGTRTILQNLGHYFPEFAGRTEFDVVGFGWFLGWNDGCGQASTDEYEFNMVNLIQDIREEFANPKMARLVCFCLYLEEYTELIQICGISGDFNPSLGV